VTDPASHDREISDLEEGLERLRADIKTYDQQIRKAAMRGETAAGDELKERRKTAYATGLQWKAELTQLKRNQSEAHDG